jgi:predicted RNA-binding Zn ribbon-like protein
VPESVAAEAVCALAVLVAATGWDRLKRCTRCGRPFLDRTAAASRLGCERHLARCSGRVA